MITRLNRAAWTFVSATPLGLTGCLIGLILAAGCGRPPQVRSPDRALRPSSPGPTTEPVVTDPALPTEAAMHYLALGDSYTIGESVEPSKRWPVQLVRRLRADQVDLAAPQIIAQTGWTTAELQSALDQESPTGPYDLVSLLIGVNNQYRGLDEQEYRAELEKLLDRAIELAGGRASRVLVISIPDWGVTPFADGQDRDRIAKAIDRFNAIKHAAAKDRGCPYIDVTPISRRAPQDPDLVAGDGLHPSAKMYRLWCEQALPVAKAALQNSGG